MLPFIVISKHRLTRVSASVRHPFFFFSRRTSPLGTYSLRNVLSSVLCHFESPMAVQSGWAAQFFFMFDLVKCVVFNNLRKSLRFKKVCRSRMVLGYKNYVFNDCTKHYVLSWSRRSYTAKEATELQPISFPLPPTSLCIWRMCKDSSFVRFILLWTRLTRSYTTFNKNKSHEQSAFVHDVVELCDVPLRNWGNITKMLRKFVPTRFHVNGNFWIIRVASGRVCSTASCAHLWFR